jgi:hypothetical protein
MQILDLAAGLAALRAATPAAGVAVDRFKAGAADAELIHLEAGRFWEDREPDPFAVLILEGVGTVHLDDWRTTALGGKLVSVPGDVRARFVADNGAPLALLVWRAIRPERLALPAPQAGR